MLHPNSLAALRAHGVRFPNGPTCKACKRRALKGRDVCWSHSGQRREPTPSRLAGRKLAGMAYRGELSPELVALPVWQGLHTSRNAVKATLRLALVLTWDTRDTDPGPWQAACRAAHDAAEHGWRWDKHGTPKGGGGFR